MTNDIVPAGQPAGNPWDRLGRLIWESAGVVPLYMVALGEPRPEARGPLLREASLRAEAVLAELRDLQARCLARHREAGTFQYADERVVTPAVEAVLGFVRAMPALLGRLAAEAAEGRGEDSAAEHYGLVYRIHDAAEAAGPRLAALAALAADPAVLARPVADEVYRRRVLLCLRGGRRMLAKELAREAALPRPDSSKWRRLLAAMMADGLIDGGRGSGGYAITPAGLNAVKDDA